MFVYARFTWFAPRMDVDGGAGAASGVEGTPAAAEQTQVTEGTAGQTGVDDQAAAEPKNEEAFAKRLAAERAKIERDYADRYKDYDTHKQISEFFQTYNNMDALTLKEQIELDRLQEQAEKQQVPVDVLRRIQELEAKAARGDELEQKNQKEEWERSYWSALDEYAKELDGVDGKAINQFLVDNSLSVNPADPKKAFDIAYKALRADLLEKKIADAEKNGMKKLIGAKGSIPTITNSTAQGQAASTAPKTFAEARQRAMQRMSQSN